MGSGATFAPMAPLQVPMSAAGMLLIGMVSRIPTRDPE